MKTLEELQAFLLTSKLRANVLKTLNKSKVPLRQTQISRKLGKRQQNISLVIMKLEKEGLVKCLTPDKKAWKVYAITELGRAAITKI